MADIKHRDLSADQIGKSRSCATIGYVRKIPHAGEGFEQFTAQVSQRSGSRRSVGELPWICFHVSDAALEVLHRNYGFTSMANAVIANMEIVAKSFIGSMSG